VAKHVLLRRCPNCGMYTLRRDKCPYCGGTPGAAHPAKFSPEDPYGEYRRKAKLAEILNQSRTGPSTFDTRG